MTVVLDCCAASEIARQTERGNALRMLMLEGEHVISPSFFLQESTNVAWKHFAFGNTPEEKCLQLLEGMISLVDDFESPDEYYAEALTEACHYNHPAYDLFYAVLARRTGATLFTVDNKLIELCDEMGVNVVREIDFA